MPKVQTIKGLIDRDLLTVNEIVDEGDNHRSIATEWYDSTGELVRRDAHVMILRGLELCGAQAELG